MIFNQLYDDSSTRSLFEQDELGNPESAPEEEPPEFTPLKKFLLLDKLSTLKDKLEVHNISIEELDVILKFGPNFSYETLLRLSDSISEIVKIKLQGMNKNAKSKESV